MSRSLDRPDAGAVELARELGLHDPHEFLSLEDRAKLVSCRDLQLALMLSLGNLPSQSAWLQLNGIPIAAIRHVGRGTVPPGSRKLPSGALPQFTAVSRKTGEVVLRRDRSDPGPRGVKCWVDRATVRGMFRSGGLNHLLTRQRADPKLILPKLAALLRDPVGPNLPAVVRPEDAETSSLYPLIDDLPVDAQFRMVSCPELWDALLLDSHVWCSQGPRPKGPELRWMQGNGLPVTAVARPGPASAAFIDARVLVDLLVDDRLEHLLPAEGEARELVLQNLTRLRNLTPEPTP